MMLRQTGIAWNVFCRRQLQRGPVAAIARGVDVPDASGTYRGGALAAVWKSFLLRAAFRTLRTDLLLFSRI
jgi:hypothetical protein